MKRYQLGFIIGRFQHIHNSHVSLIKQGLVNCERVMVMVGSSQESGTKKNPYNLYTRMQLIRKVFPQEIKEGRILLAHTDDMLDANDNGHVWGEFLLRKINMWRGHYGVESNVDCFIYGNDEERASWFKKEDMSGISHIINAREVDGVSATLIRELLLYENKKSWKSLTPTEIHDCYEQLRSELLSVWYYQDQLKIKEGLERGKVF